MYSKQQLAEFFQSLFDFIKSRLLANIFYIGLSLIVGYSLVDMVVISELKSIIGTLQNISAAVFTLAGIWIAYSYPQAISAYTSPNSVKVIPSDETKRIENLVLIVLTSAFVISSLLAFNLLYLLVSKILVGAELRLILRGLAISFIFYLSFIQIKAIFVVMITNISFVNELHNKKTERSAHDDL